LRLRPIPEALMRPVPQIALDFIQGAEACVLTAYRDTGGKPTIGIGHTGPEVVMGMVITQAQALAYLFADAVKAATKIANSVSDAAIQALTEHEYAALVSFSFNVGFGHADCPTLIAALEAKNLNAVPIQMMRFNHGVVGGVEQVIPGLTHRRMAEVVLWRHPDVDAALAIVAAAPDVAPPSSETVAMDTPPAPLPAGALAKSGHFVAACATGIGTAGYAVATNVKSVGDGITGALAPYIDHSSILQALSGHVMVVAGAASAAVPVLMWLSNKKAQQ
jgi:lysozyme